MSGLGFDPNGGYNQEYILNQETRNLTLSPYKNAKAVVIYDSSGNALTPPSIGTGGADGTVTVTTAGTAVQITATPTTIKGVWVNSDIKQGAIMTVGRSTVKGNASGMRGVVLTPGNQPIFIQVNDLSLLWVDTDTNGGKLAYLTIT